MDERGKAGGTSAMDGERAREGRAHICLIANRHNGSCRHGATRRQIQPQCPARPRVSGGRTCSRWSSCTRSKLLVSIPIPARYAVNRASLPVPSAASTSVVVPFTAEGVEVESFSSSASELSSDGERVGTAFGSIEREVVAMASPLALEARASEERLSGVRACERSKRERERREAGRVSVCGNPFDPRLEPQQPADNPACSPNSDHAGCCERSTNTHPPKFSAPYRTASSVGGDGRAGRCRVSTARDKGGRKWADEGQPSPRRRCWRTFSSLLPITLSLTRMRMQCTQNHTPLPPRQPRNRRYLLPLPLPPLASVREGHPPPQQPKPSTRSSRPSWALRLS